MMSRFCCAVCNMVFCEQSDKLKFIVLCKTFFEKKVLHSKKLSNWQREQKAKGSAKEKDVKNERAHFWRFFLQRRRTAPQYLVLQPFACILYTYQLFESFWGGGGDFFQKVPHIITLVQTLIYHPVYYKKKTAEAVFYKFFSLFSLLFSLKKNHR